MTTTSKTSTSIVPTTLQTEAPDPIGNAYRNIAAHPATTATTQAAKSVWDGFQAIWQFEEENRFGRSAIGFGRDIFVAILLPILLLIGNGLKAIYAWLCNPETHKGASEKWAKVQAWAAPHYDYEATATEPKA